MQKKILFPCFALALCGASHVAYAHTTIKDQASEGSTLYTAFTITHGCGDQTKPDSFDVIAQSVTFPNGFDAVVTNLSDDSEIDISTVIDGAIGGLSNLSPGAIQDKSVFDVIEEISDSNDNVRAFHFSNSNEDGSLQHDLVGVIPFRVSGLTFKTDSCARSVKARIAIANWCTRRAGVRRVDVWMGHTTPIFNDDRVVSIGFWPTLTINRNLDTNPLPESCGEGFDVAVEPTDTDIDQYLTIPGFIPGL